VYPTPGSLAKYHLPPFQAAIDAGTSSVMPYYAIPSAEKSAMPQPPLEEFEQVGFAFNTGCPRADAGDGTCRLHQLRLWDLVQDGLGCDRN
jgi:hypothetical protein